MNTRSKRSKDKEDTPAKDNVIYAESDIIAIYDESYPDRFYLALVDKEVFINRNITIYRRGNTVNERKSHY